MAFYPSQLPGPLRRGFWGLAYQLLARLWQRADWRMMNYGYEPDHDEPEGRPHLDASDEPDRVCMQLYHRVARQRTLDGKRVLEIGSGRGGGAYFVHRYHRPASMLGMDRSEAAVALSRKRVQAEGLRYEVGDAEAIPLPDASVDVVLNVESCHCYGSVPTFLSEVRRVLAPGGHLLLADLRLSERQAAFDEELRQSGMIVEERVDITDGVVRGLRVDTPRRKQLIREAAPWGLGGVMRAFAATEGSATFEDLASRNFVYYCYALRKP